MTKRFFSLATLAVLLIVSACGDLALDKLDQTAVVTSDTNVVSEIDMSTLGVDPRDLGHDEFLEGSTHSEFSCDDCHLAPTDAGTPKMVCTQSGCHPFTKYESKMTNFDHTANNTGERCTSCHKSLEVAVAGEDPPIAGFRKNLRIVDTDFHEVVQGVCLDCHTIENVAAFPDSHVGNANRETACEGCHTYEIKNSAGWWAGAHPQKTTGCADTGCHAVADHYSSAPSGTYQCEWCHSDAITSNYTSWSGYGHRDESSEGCGACHKNGNYDDDDMEGFEGDDDIFDDDDDHFDND